ncbi:hypothetical protein K502DRAFT_236903 [Neoconidiobolus thromboides FSU 785]|nr:hypothetical protein K502DRAFT_236903 [Neoconidiobolus thromboides FSU 785]
MVILSLYNRRLVDRVSLRLQTGLSVYDVWLHGGAIWRSISPAGANASCTTRGYLALFFNVFYAFLNVSIAINLQLVFLNNQIITKKMEAMYWLIPLTLSLILSIPPLGNLFL